jgi:hypothetical protein
MTASLPSLRLFKHSELDIGFCGSSDSINVCDIAVDMNEYHLLAHVFLIRMVPLVVHIIRRGGH